MSRRKVCVVVNSRANYGRIKSFMVAAQKHRGLIYSLSSEPPLSYTDLVRRSMSCEGMVSSRTPSFIQ